jgi:hypothetical protein
MNTRNWKKFKMNDLFIIQQETRDNQAGKLGDGNIPLVSAGKNNNGVVKRINTCVKGSTLFPAYTITLDMFGKAYLQLEDFYAVSHGRVTMLIPKLEVMKNNFIGHFLAAVIGKHFGKFSSYDNMCCKRVIYGEEIMLPVNDNDEPDWDFMRSKMEGYQSIADEKMKSCKNVFSMNSIDTSSWKDFYIGGDDGLFILKRGRSPKRRSGVGSVPFVSASKENNGVTALVQSDGKEFTGGKISANNDGSVGYAFYQANDFMACASVTVLDVNTKAFPDFILDEDLALFLCVILRQRGKEYNYGDKWGIEVMEKNTIPLPVSNTGQPDWDYMRHFIKSMRQKLL